MVLWTTQRDNKVVNSLFWYSGCTFPSSNFTIILKAPTISMNILYRFCDYLTRIGFPDFTRITRKKISNVYFNLYKLLLLYSVLNAMDRLWIVSWVLLFAGVSSSCLLERRPLRIVFRIKIAMILNKCWKPSELTLKITNSFAMPSTPSTEPGPPVSSYYCLLH